MNRKICLVTGASRGAGRGIALALGDTGATVYVTGRTLQSSDAADGLQGTITETAEAVTQRGGRGIAVACDHRNEIEVRDLVARIEGEEGRLDLLVNNAWGGYESYDNNTFGAPFWKSDPELWGRMIGNGVRLAYVTSRAAAPLMIATGAGLIINITAWDRDRYLHALLYDVAKAAVNRMAFGMAQELHHHGIAVIALAPGWMRTERVMQAHAENRFDLSSTESTEYVGRVVAALADDPTIMSKSGQIFRAGDLAPDYDVHDVDGSQPPGFDVPLYAPPESD